MHRIGGLEKQDVTGAISYDPANHQHMIDLRAGKSPGIAADIPPQVGRGPGGRPVLVVGWGGTYGALTTAVRRLRERGASVALRPSALPESLAGQPWRDPAPL